MRPTRAELLAEIKNLRRRLKKLLANERRHRLKRLKPRAARRGKWCGDQKRRKCRARR